jgi:hypothetical protein
VYRIYTDPKRIGEWQSGLREASTSGALDVVGTRWSARFEGPFKIDATVIAAEPPRLHQQRFKEMLGAVTCTTTARFSEIPTGTRLDVDFDYRVVQPLRLLFDQMAGNEMVTRFKKDIARLTSLAEGEVS